MAFTIVLNDGSKHVILSDDIVKQQQEFARIVMDKLGHEAEKFFRHITGQQPPDPEEIADLQQDRNRLEQALDASENEVQELEITTSDYESAFRRMRRLLDVCAEIIEDMPASDELATLEDKIKEARSEIPATIS